MSDKTDLKNICSKKRGCKLKPILSIVITILFSFVYVGLYLPVIYGVFFSFISEKSKLRNKFTAILIYVIGVVVVCFIAFKEIF
jgi:hypothetical protein